MNRIRNLFKEEIREAAASLAERLPVTAPQLNELDDNEIKELDELIKKIDDTSNQNEQITAVKDSAGVLVKLLKKVF